MCDIHGEYLFSTPGTPPRKKCCGVFFNPKPFFVNTGTCFTSYQEVWEKWPFTFSFLKVWLNVQSSISPGYIFKLKLLNNYQTYERSIFAQQNIERYCWSCLKPKHKKIKKMAKLNMFLS
jgi:hypothetical protein